MCRKYNYVNVFMVWLWYSILFFVNNIEFMEVIQGILIYTLLDIICR